MSLVVEGQPAEWPDPRSIAPVPAQTEYHFLLGRYVDAPILARAHSLAALWGVQPHDVLIANGWLDAGDYYKALAETCGVAFKPALSTAETALPENASPRQCLANGILKERQRARRFVLAPERLTPNTLRAMLTQLAPYNFTLTTPRAVRNAVYRHVAPYLARGAVEGLAGRRPEQSARTGMARWQKLCLVSIPAGLILALLLAPTETIRVLTLLLALVFVPVISLRAVAAYRLLCRYTENGHHPSSRPAQDADLPTYTILAPLYREAHMLALLLQALTLMAWDPFNVTEDADLSTRLARNGYRARIIPSTTYEEAPRRFGGWLRQRTRWLKGFIQTWLVHMRSPRRLWRELGLRGFIAFQVMVGGTVLSALVHPWFYALVAYDLLGGGFMARPASGLGLPFWSIAWFDLVMGYVAAMTLAFLAARRRKLFGLSWQILLMPFYWLLISAAAYRAVWQFATAPFTWEKTEHGSAAARRGRLIRNSGSQAKLSVQSMSPR